MFREGAVFNFRKNEKNFVSYALQFVTRYAVTVKVLTKGQATSTTVKESLRKELLKSVSCIFQGLKRK